MRNTMHKMIALCCCCASLEAKGDVHAYIC